MQGDTAVPATQANVIDNTQFLTARQDQRTPDGAFINTYDSLTFRVDADGDVIEAVVIDPSLSGSEAGRRAALSWWTTELNNGGPITFSGLNAAGDTTIPYFTGTVEAVGNRPGRSTGRGQAYLRIRVTAYDNDNIQADFFTNNQGQWLQDTTDINLFYYRADGQLADEYFSRWTTNARSAIIHQNAAYVGRVSEDGSVEFNPRQVPVIFEPNTQYYAGQTLQVSSPTTIVFYRVTEDWLAGTGVDTRFLHRVDVLSNIDNTDIEPRSVRIGGSVEGQFVWQQEDTQIIVNSQVGAEVTTNFTKQATTNFVLVADVPVGIANGSSYLLRITAVPDEEIDFAVGDYLIDFVTDNVFNTFTNIRPVIDGNARDPLDLTNSVSGTYTYNIRNFVDSDVLVLTNDRRDDDPPTPQVDTVRVNSATNVWDFTETPTVGVFLLVLVLLQLSSVLLLTYHCRLRRYLKTHLLCII